MAFGAVVRNPQTSCGPRLGAAISFRPQPRLRSGTQQGPTIMAASALLSFNQITFRTGLLLSLRIEKCYHWNDQKSANRVGVRFFLRGQLSLERCQQRLGGEHGASSFQRELGTTSPIPGRRQCRSMRSTRPPTTRPARCRQQRRWPRPIKTTSQRLGLCSQNIRPINTGDPM